MKFKPIYLIAIVVFLFVVDLTSAYWTHGSAVVTVTGTEVKRYSDEGDKYLVYTDRGVFENTDSWAYFKFDSSDTQGILMQRGKFKISYYGFRIPFLSSYKNIISAEKVQ